MKSATELKKGQKLRYIGTHFEGFDAKDTYMIFLGYDSNGWKDIWVDYKGKSVLINLEHVERCKSESKSYCF